MDRRTFLRRAGHAGGGLAASRLMTGGRLSPARSRASRDRITVGVITEPNAKHLDLYLASLGSAPGVDEIALADPSGASTALARKLLGARAARLRTYRDPQQMLRSVKPALAMITVEARHAPRWMKAALEADCHVLSEKPPCVRIEDFEPLVPLAEARRRHLMLALSTRVAPPALKARELVREGYLGKLYGASMHWVADQTRLKDTAYHKLWVADRSRAGGGQLIMHGIHYLDLIQYITGDRVRRVSGFYGNVGGQPIDTEDAAVAAMEFRGGMVGTLNTGYYLDRGYQNALRLWGAEGWLRIAFDGEAWLPLQWYSTRAGAPAGVQSAPYSGTPDPYDLMTQAAIRAAAGTGPPPITPGECLAVVRTIFAAYRAADSGTTQTVD